MGRWQALRSIPAVLGAAALVLAFPPAGAADHVTATLSVSAQLGERVGNSWQVVVDWSITCNGANSPSYFGNLYLDEDGGTPIYLGGTAGGSGRDTATVEATTVARHLKPRLKGSCTSNPDLHGSPTVELVGGEVVVPARACDPALLEKALREFATGRSFYDAGSADLRNAHDEWVDSRNEYVKESAEIGAEKAVGIKILHGLAGEEVLLAVEVTAFWVGIGVTIEEVLLKLIPALRETRAAFREAHEDFERGEQWTKRAEADLAAALAQGPCTPVTRDKLNRALAEQEAQDAARRLIDSWENNGYLYLNPATGELLDEAAALKAARNALTAKRSTQARTTQARGRKVFANRRQVGAAVAKLTAARGLNERVRYRARNADAAAERLRSRLAALLH